MSITPVPGPRGVLPRHGGAHSEFSPLLPDLTSAFVGLLALYIPTYLDLFETFWRTGRSVQGPVILGWVAWVLWRDRASLGLQSTCGRSPAAIVALSVVMRRAGLGEGRIGLYFREDELAVSRLEGTR